jgi:hypothetical protein
MKAYYKSVWAILGILLISAAAVLLTGCREGTRSKQQLEDKDPSSKRGQEGAKEERPPEYKLRTRWVDIHASYVITINGFPVRRLRYKGRASDDEFNVPLNTALIGERNRASLRFEPLLLRERKELSLGMIEVEAEVLGPGDDTVPGAKITKAQVDSVYEAWRERAQKKWKDYRTTVEQGALDSIRAWAERNPLTVSTTFDNKRGPDFSRVFEEPPRLPDTPATRERLRDYAMRLRDLMAEKDTSALFEEFRPSIMARLKVHDVESRSEFLAKNRKGVILEDAVLDFGREDVRLRKWAEGRIWEVWRAGSEDQLFFARPSGYGMSELYVAEIDGKLRVVR